MIEKTDYYYSQSCQLNVTHKQNPSFAMYDVYDIHKLSPCIERKMHIMKGNKPGLNLLKNLLSTTNFTA